MVGQMCAYARQQPMDGDSAALIFLRFLGKQEKKSVVENFVRMFSINVP